MVFVTLMDKTNKKIEILNLNEIILEEKLKNGYELISMFDSEKLKIKMNNIKN